jgi:hypothetical protein
MGEAVVSQAWAAVVAPIDSPVGTGAAGQRAARRDLREPTARLEAELADALVVAFSDARLGLIGMLAGWWQVKLSSGCPSSF